MSLREARSIAGSLGFPSKMPGTSYGLPASACKTGALLAQIPGTACSICYALRDRYSWPNPKKAQERRLASLSDPQWVTAMVTLLNHAHSRPYRRIDLGHRGAKLNRVGRYRMNEMGFHRWHDSGDIQSVDHLRKIIEVARRTPTIRHWLPTNELSMVMVVALTEAIPENLTIRVSSIKIDDLTRRNWPQTSSVYTETSPPDAHICPAPFQGHQCGPCRACWDRDVRHVAYLKH